MTEPRNRLVDLTVIGLSALVVGASMLVVADVDAGKPRVADPDTHLPAAAAAATLARPPAIPAPGLQPAPRKAARRVVVVRRSRAS